MIEYIIISLIIILWIFQYFAYRKLSPSKKQLFCFLMLTGFIISLILEKIIGYKIYFLLQTIFLILDIFASVFWKEN